MEKKIIGDSKSTRDIDSDENAVVLSYLNNSPIHNNGMVFFQGISPKCSFDALLIMLGEHGYGKKFIHANDYKGFFSTAETIKEMSIEEIFNIAYPEDYDNV